MQPIVVVGLRARPPDPLDQNSMSCVCWMMMNFDLIVFQALRGVVTPKEQRSLFWVGLVQQNRLQNIFMHPGGPCPSMIGMMAVTAAPMFEHAGRNSKVYWGDKEARGPMVVLWDSLTEEGKKGVSRRTEDNKRLGDQVGERTAETVMKI